MRQYSNITCQHDSSNLSRPSVHAIDDCIQTFDLDYRECQRSLMGNAVQQPILPNITHALKAFHLTSLMATTWLAAGEEKWYRQRPRAEVSLHCAHTSRHELRKSSAFPADKHQQAFHATSKTKQDKATGTSMRGSVITTTMIAGTCKYQILLKNCNSNMASAFLHSHCGYDVRFANPPAMCLQHILSCLKCSFMHKVHSCGGSWNNLHIKRRSCTCTYMYIAKSKPASGTTHIASQNS